MRARSPIAIALLVSLLACAVLTIQWQRAERRADETARWTRFVMDSLSATVNLPRPPVEPWGRDSVYWQWVATTAQMQSRRWHLAVQHWARSKGTMLNALEIEELKQQGFPDPAAQLRDSLRAHPELIPYPGEHGGRMMFNDIVLLGSPLAFAKFEDGHNGGEMLLEYTVLDSGIVSWERLWSRLY